MSKKISGVLCFGPLVLFVVSLLLFLVFFVMHYDDPQIILGNYVIFIQYVCISDILVPIHLQRGKTNFIDIAD